MPRVALGSAIFGGVGSLPDLFGRGEGRDAAFALMDAAWAGGIRTFDTADAYGGGTSERWIGEWIRERGLRPSIITKTFNPVDAVGDSGLSRARVMRQVQTSLERLSVDRIDLYLAHEFDANTPLIETMETFQELIDKGLVAAFGVSNFSTAQLESTLSVARPAVIQNSYSLLNRLDERELIPLAHRHGILYQAYSPLAGGWLSGRYGKDGSVESGSRLAVAPQWYEHIDAKRALDAIARMETIAEREGSDLSTLAHSWILAQPLVGGVVVGPRRVEHLRSIFVALERPLTPTVVAELSSIFRLTN